MAHQVKDWMSSPVIVIDPDSCVNYALTLMRRRRIHSLVVVLNDSESRYGILTSTDIRNKILAAERQPAEVAVRESMTAPVLTAQADWSLTECSRRMQAAHINHMPVVDENNQLVGIISTTDLFVAAEEIGWEGNP